MISYFFNTSSRSRPKKYITELSINENLACCSVGIYAYSSLFSHPVYTAFDFKLSSYLFSSPLPKFFFVQFFVRISNQQDTPARAPSR